MWLGRRDGGLTPGERSAFNAWLAADPRHAEAYRRLAHYDRRLDRLRELAPAPDAPPARVVSFPMRRWAAIAGVAAALVIGAYVAQVHFVRPDFVEQRTTVAGAWDRLRLPDGSAVELNSDSSVRAAYRSGERAIELLRGEAYFSVERDRARPFVVSVGNLRVRAVGTAFVVRRRGEDVEVTVTSGSVGISETPKASPSNARGSEQETLLEAGQRAVIRSAQPSGETGREVAVDTLTSEQVSRRLAWQERRIEFEPTPLREVVAEMNRYSPHRLVIADPELGEESVGGSFRAGDHETLVRLLEGSLGLRVERRSGETVLHRAEP